DLTEIWDVLGGGLRTLLDAFRGGPLNPCGRPSHKPNRFTDGLPACHLAAATGSEQVAPWLQPARDASSASPATCPSRAGTRLLPSPGSTAVLPTRAFRPRRLLTPPPRPRQTRRRRRLSSVPVRATGPGRAARVRPALAA